MTSFQQNLSRDEQELLAYFRGLPLDQQTDILAAAETSYNAFERMKELTSREVERGGARDDFENRRWQ
ncbi:MAG: hypothetical protein WDA20_01270 [Desulfuromonadales bacterium]|jgi:hypothetical protein